MPHPSRACALLLVLAACASDGTPTAPAAPPPDLAAAAFRLTIDVETGRVRVAPPAHAARAGEGLRPSLSLIGGDAVALHATDCVWGVAASSKLKRCTFQLAVENRLGSVDLVTPTTFPEPPAGTDGILVFPYASGAITTAGGGVAVPTADWDNAPISFFSQTGCARGATDCYRYETYAGALYGGQTSAARTVGFDVDRTARSVSVYVVVAADLRDNPVRQLVLPATAALCGRVERYYVNYAPNNAIVAAGGLFVGNTETYFVLTSTTARRSLCSFALPDALDGATVVGATLELHERAPFELPYSSANAVIVDHVDFGALLEVAGYDVPALQAAIGVVSTGGAVGLRTLDVRDALAADLAAGRTRTQYRLRLLQDALTTANGFAVFDGAADAQPPRVLVSYRAH